MLNLEKVAEIFAKEKNIHLNSFDLSNIRSIQRISKDMSPSEIVDKLSKEKKFSLELVDRNSRKQLEELIKKSK